MATKRQSPGSTIRDLWNKFTAPGVLKTFHYGRVRSTGFRLFHGCGISFIAVVIFGMTLTYFVPAATHLMVAIGIILITGWFIGAGMFLFGPDRKYKVSV